jgi:hypothetical protein
MSGFGPSLAQPSAAAQDPTKHVNYALGMVLGVDDLTQEFAYLSQRDQWMVRDLDGYGTVWGLALSIRDNGLPRGPEIVVSPGVAVNPRGQLIRVAPAQCAALNEWLKPRGSDILKRRIATANPNLFQLPLDVVLSYRTCLTDAVPIAGEPCRSEEDSTAPSRVADDFLLELQLDAPPQQEEDALRELVQWLRQHIVITAGAASQSIAQFLDMIRAAANAARQAVSSPPSSPPGGGQFLLDLSPVTPLSVPASQLPDYLRAAAKLYVTELRPLWRPNWLGQKHGCAGTELLVSPDEGNRVLLGKLTLIIGPDGLGSSVWTVQGPITISDDTRPFLLQLRLLQEWLLTQSASAATAGASLVAAAGIINATPGVPSGRLALNAPRIAAVTNIAGATNLRLLFNGYNLPPPTGGPQYVVKVLPWSTLLNLTITFAGFQSDGIILSVSKGGSVLTAGELSGLQLLVEVTQLD